MDNGKVLFCVPEDMESHVLFKYHDEMGHIGTDKMVDLITKNYWFGKMREKAGNHIQNCLKCIVFSSKYGKEEGILHNIPKKDRPFEVIHVDHFGPVDNSRSKKHIFVVIDACTKFVRLYATKTTIAKEVINAPRDYFRSYSRPKTIISDRGSCFTSNEFVQFLEGETIQHIKIATDSPQANGQVERVNRSLGPMIAKLCDSERNIHWDNVVETVEYALNNSIHRTIKEYPSVMLFGIKQRGQAVDLLSENLIEGKQNPGQQNHEKVRGAAAANEKRLQSYNNNYVNRKRRTANQYNKGDYVMIKNFDSTAGVSRKLIPKFKGPYKVSKVLRNDRYVLEDVEGFQQSRIPYVGVWAVANIRPWFGQRRISNKNK